MITVLSLGAGVQSSALALMAAYGEVKPMPDCAIFADTGWEPREVCEHLDRLEKMLPFPVHRVAKGNLREEQIMARLRGGRLNGARWAALPYYTRNADGTIGLVRRQCTSEYKIQPIDKFIRQELLGLAPRQRAPKHQVLEQWYGISHDELQRCKVEFVEPWRRNRYPLVEQRLTRGHCIEWLAKHGISAPRSACLGCPFHSDEEWQRILADPESRADVIEFDEAIRTASGMRGETFLHRSAVPLKDAKLQTASLAGQVSWLDECDGMCGT